MDSKKKYEELKEEGRLPKKKTPNSFFESVQISNLNGSQGMPWTHEDTKEVWETLKDPNFFKDK